MPSSTISLYLCCLTHRHQANKVPFCIYLSSHHVVSGLDFSCSEVKHDHSSFFFRNFICIKYRPPKNAPNGWQHPTTRNVVWHRCARCKTRRKNYTYRATTTRAKTWLAKDISLNDFIFDNAIKSCFLCSRSWCCCCRCSFYSFQVALKRKTTSTIQLVAIIDWSEQV